MRFSNHKRLGLGMAAGLGALAATIAPALAADAPKIDTGDTAWMLTSSALVLLMTIPGLGLFYAGMVRKKNVLATLAQSFAICCLITIVWCVIGYTLAFNKGDAYIGDLGNFMLQGFAKTFNNDFLLGGTVDETIPESVFMMFQMTFAIITPALICGAFADRMKFSAMCIFMVLWSIFVYSPVAHWVWGATGWVNALGVADFAGGTVVH